MSSTLGSTPTFLKLADALRVVSRNPQPPAETFRVQLACGFTPLHLQTFLAAELRLRMPLHHVAVGTGLYEDTAGTLRHARGERLDAVVLVIEWFDLDARLGLRRLGGWSPQSGTEIVERAAIWLAEIRSLVDQVADTSPVVMSLPSLPFPPLFRTPGGQACLEEVQLRERLWRFAASVGAHPRVRIVSDQARDLVSPPSDRLHVGSTFLSGFPYQLPHAAKLASLLARAVHNPPPMKGLITDLDNTFWSGIVGDDGADAVSWDLDHRSQAHGLYQQLLASLSEAGVLIGVASKNDPRVVDETFTRDDLLMPASRLFPMAVSWGSKADAVARVLKAWNVGAESVVFVDDNPAELAEVAAAHPAIQCMQFPHGDAAGIYQLLGQLRDLFGRSHISEEDAIRLDSLRAQASAFDADEQGGGFSETLLEQADAELTVDFTKDDADGRALALINKTNQFNLNGRRITDRAWAERLADPATFVMRVNYRDRFGPLGTIAIMAGRIEGSRVRIDTWVMSCRAFARRIEHQSLRVLFDRFGAGEVVLDYAQTPRNGPLTTFLSDISGAAAQPDMTMSSDTFTAACPRLFHRVALKEASPA
jgi:FkbH-like protein